jgi:type VII secretion integral membrane protein EccD
VTGAAELRTVQTMSAAPEAVRVSVFGGPTQLDVALPADVPVAAFLPELARLIGSRDSRRDEDVVDRDERRTFWVLRRVDGDIVLEPEQTLRSVGVKNGELLRISAQQALSPPTLYDDVVDAAARLNRASYAAWDATAAAVMAFAGLWLCTAAWVYFLVADALSAHRAIVVGGAVLTTATMVVGAALVYRTLGRTDIASAAGWPAVTLTAALGWVLTTRFGEYGHAALCVVLLALVAVYYRVIGTGHWAYIAAAVVFAFGAFGLLGSALGGRIEVLAVAAATTATLGCLAVPRLTANLAGFPTLTLWPAAARRDLGGDDPFARSGGTDSAAAMPSAEVVWARARSATLTRAGLLAGLGAVAVAGATALLRTVSGWPALIFALICAAVLALRCRWARTVPERAALVVAATALVLMASVQAHAGAEPLRLAGVGALAVIAVVATLAGLAVAGGGLPRWLSTAVAYLEYAAVAALIPLALWPLGIYDRLGL